MSLLIVAAVIIFTLWASLYVGGMSDNFSDMPEAYEFKQEVSKGSPQPKKYAPFFHRKRFKNFNNRR